MNEPNEIEETAPAFPLDALPEPMRAFVAEVARVHQLPVELPGSMALATVSAALGQSAILDNPPHKTPPNLFFLDTAPSGSGKTAGYSMTTRPLFDLQGRLMAEHAKNEIPDLLAEKHLVTSGIQQSKKMKGMNPGERAEAISSLGKAMARLREIEAALSPPRLLAEDATPPKLAALMATNGQTMALFSSEGGDVVSNIAGRHNATGRTDETLFLKGFSRDPHTQDRVGTGTVQLNSPCLTVLLITTPDEAAGLFDCERFSQGGLLPRFLVCAPEMRWQHDNGESRIADAATVASWESLIVNLAESFRLRDGEPETIQAEPEALGLLRAKANDYADRFDELKEQQSFAARHVEYAARLALVLHCAKHGDKAGRVTLDKATMARAFALLDYFIGQQGKMLAKGLATAREQRLNGLLTALARYENSQANMADLKKRNGFDRGEIEQLHKAFPGRLTVLEMKGPKGGRPSTVVSIR